MKKLLCILMILSVITLAFTGCKKTSEEPEPVQTAEQMKADADKEITESNVEEEFEKLEKEIEADLINE